MGRKEKLLVMSNFSFSHSVFKISTTDTYKPGLVWEGLMTAKAASENFVGKGEKSGNQHSLLFQALPALSKTRFTI